LAIDNSSGRRDWGRYVAWKDRLRAVFPGSSDIRFFRYQVSPLPDFPDTIIFPHLEKRFVKHSAQGYAREAGGPVVG